jgi:CBS domain-containing protein
VGVVVAEAMVTDPKTHGPPTTVGELRSFFCDDHVHLALLVQGGRLLSTVERHDLPMDLDDSAPAWPAGTLVGRTIRPDASAAAAHERMRRSGRRRLAVIDDHGALLGLLCLKASGDGFCSDRDVANRAT